MPSLFNAKGIIGFIEDEIIKPFKIPDHILSDNDLKFDCAAVHDFSSKHDIDWKRTATYNPMGNGIARRTVGTVKRAMQRMMRTEDIEWYAWIDGVLHGYRHRQREDGKSPFEILYGVQPRFQKRGVGYRCTTGQNCYGKNV